ncbi:MAG TPA: hypothetical protein DDZ40_11975 [Deltaproteobacteria bacterium]|nr:hypothetical protein [Deltaproteobacteria bacterium]
MFVPWATAKGPAEAGQIPEALAAGLFAAPVEAARFPAPPAPRVEAEPEFVEASPAPGWVVPGIRLVAAQSVAGPAPCGETFQSWPAYPGRPQGNGS